MNIAIGSSATVLTIILRRALDKNRIMAITKGNAPTKFIAGCIPALLGLFRPSLGVVACGLYYILKGISKGLMVVTRRKRGGGNRTKKHLHKSWLLKNLSEGTNEKKKDALEYLCRDVAEISSTSKTNFTLNSGEVSNDTNSNISGPSLCANQKKSKTPRCVRSKVSKLCLERRSSCCLKHSKSSMSHQTRSVTDTKMVGVYYRKNDPDVEEFLDDPQLEAQLFKKYCTSQADLNIFETSLLESNDEVAQAKPQQQPRSNIFDINVKQSGSHEEEAISNSLTTSDLDNSKRTIPISDSGGNTTNEEASSLNDKKNKSQKLYEQGSFYVDDVDYATWIHATKSYITTGQRGRPRKKRRHKTCLTHQNCKGKRKRGSCKLCIEERRKLKAAFNKAAALTKASRRKAKKISASESSDLKSTVGGRRSGRTCSGKLKRTS